MRTAICIRGNSPFSPASMVSPSSPGILISVKRMSGRYRRMAWAPETASWARAATWQLWAVQSTTFRSPSVMMDSSSISTTLYINRCLPVFQSGIPSAKGRGNPFFIIPENVPGAQALSFDSPRSETFDNVFLQRNVNNEHRHHNEHHRGGHQAVIHSRL